MFWYGIGILYDCILLYVSVHDYLQLSYMFYESWNPFWEIPKGSTPQQLAPENRLGFKRKKSYSNHPFSGATVDGSEIPQSPVDMGNIPIIYRVLYIPGGWPWDFWTIHSYVTFREGPFLTI